MAVDGPDRTGGGGAAHGSGLLAIDGNALGHRAYHSTRGEEDADRPGIVTAVVASMLASVWIHGPYRVVATAFDGPRNRRRELDAAYKAHRPPSPPDLAEHLGLLRTHLGEAGLGVLVVEDAEADDVLVALADGCVERGVRCDVLSPDRDLTSVVGPGVRLLRPRQRFADLVVEDQERVRATYGVEPWQYPDLAALRGDPSDNLEGARGIGERTAARLVRDHGSLAGVLAAIPDLPPRVAGSLREARERVERNLLLMSPLAHLPVDVDALLVAEHRPARLADLVDGLGFRSAARRLRRALEAPSAPGRAQPEE